MKSMERSNRRSAAANWKAGAGVILGLIAALAAGTASAVNIVPIWEASDAYPEEDPDGSAMQAMMAHVETYLEDIFEAPGTLTVYYRYMTGGFGVHNNLTVSNGKPTSCRIQLSSDYDWWYDPTPEDDSEFNMVSKQASQYSSTNLATYYNGTVPGLLEVQCQGSTKSSAPAEAKAHFDAWTVLIHEMGHGLGMTGRVAGTEYADDDYDVDPQLAWGNTMAININGTDPVHLAAPALMHGGEIRGRRKLLSATDILAIETAANWGDTTIDLLRKDFYSASASAMWNVNGNWAGNRAPDAADAAFIRHGGAVALPGDTSVASLSVSASSTLSLAKEAALTAQSFTLANGVTTIMELGGLDPGVNSAQIHVTGAAVVDGTLDIRLAAGYQPQTGDTFTIFDFDGTRTGSFDQVLVPDHYTFDLTRLLTEGTITITNSNVPIAVDDMFALNEDATAVWHDYEGVLVNDVDPTPATAMEAVLTTETAHGTLTLYSTGAIEYTPQTNYHGTDSFTYKARDGEVESNPAVVTLNIAPVNDAPVGVEDTYMVSEGGVLIAYFYEGVLVNDLEPDDPQSVPEEVLTAVNESGPSHGSLLWYSGGAFKYTPATGYYGTDSFTYRAYDGEAYSDVTTVLINVIADMETWIAGDANGDGTVDEDDATILAAHWGDGQADPSMGDFNDDGWVGAADAAILAANWGARTESSAATVPEPATLALLLAATILAPARRRR